MVLPASDQRLETATFANGCPNQSGLYTWGHFPSPHLQQGGRDLRPHQHCHSPRENTHEQRANREKTETEARESREK